MDDTCEHGLSRRSLRVETSYEFSWKVKVMIKKKRRKKTATTLFGTN